MTVSYPENDLSTNRTSWEREVYTQHLADFEKEKGQQSQREFAKANNISHSTFQSWHQRKRELCKQSKVAHFCESPEGLAFIHRVVVAAQFVITQLGGGGIRRVCTFLELSQLDQFVAASYGSQQSSIVRMEQEIGDYGQQERTRLALQMPLRNLSLCLDETFHPECCLVALDAVSGYIFTEQYSEKRDASSWYAALSPAFEGLNVKLVQCVSDEASGLLSLVENSLGVHSAPDLFHVQHEVVKATSLALSRQSKIAQELLEKADDDGKEEQKKRFQEAEERQESMRSAIRGLSKVYHPIDLESGQVRLNEIGRAHV